MRIGEVAALVGVTPRAVRHYHQLGLLPEPLRRSNGYRTYGVREAVLLARIRRLTELGLGLDEVRDALADTEGHDLAEVLRELDADLARQEVVTRQRRTRLAPLLDQAQGGSLALTGPVSPELTGLLAALGDVGGSPMAVKDREHLAFLDAATPRGRRGALMAALQGMRQHAAEVYGLLDGLVGQEPDDPQVPRAASALEALLPDALATHVPGTSTDGLAVGLADALYEDLDPAQAAAVRRALELVKRRQEEQA
ncbi:MerR family transcriptional regulator [Streptomyces sp. NBC_00878]|uniref:MerR family transcriptional regulator n=1 Tax=Streptomyces sp. NBC_00878 TaxID=2975854 RepID=UPI00225BEC34|nr:MerR family transcriptional regulator [Streptomyces sp. NBC_00878]MCX4911775.1 MerR family transcriptional regulator [Streptomyces sp. NBC_00878]